VLLCRLSEMVSVHRVHTHERDDVFSRAEMSSETISQLSDRTCSVDEQYQFFQEMRGYVRDLVECLNEKVGLQCSLPLYLTFCHFLSSDSLLLFSSSSSRFLTLVEA